MKRTTIGRRRAIFWSAVLLSLGMGIAAGYVYTSPLISHPLFNYILGLVGALSIVLAGTLIMLALIFWGINNNIKKGPRYALRSASLLAKIRKALCESGYYIRLGRGVYSVLRLPEITIEFCDGFQRVKIAIQNHPALDRSLDRLLLASCLGHYIVDQHYLSNCGNWHIFEVSDSRIQRQERYNSADSFLASVRRLCSDYELFIDAGNPPIPLIHTLIVGATGGGKTYFIYSLILQLLAKNIRHQLYLADPKNSDIAVVGSHIAPERTASDVDEIIELLRKFCKAMERRKKEINERLYQKLGVTYAELGLPAHIMIIDEFSSFISIVNTMKKEVRDEVSALLKTVVMQGRQLGFFVFIAMQQSGANMLSTDIRDNLKCKVLLGAADESTEIVCFGASAAAQIPNRKYSAGQGVFACDGLTHKGHPKLCYVPTLNFDILVAATSLASDKNGGYVITPVPQQEKLENNERGTSDGK